VLGDEILSLGYFTEVEHLIRIYLFNACTCVSVRLVRIDCPSYVIVTPTLNPRHVPYTNEFLLKPSVLRNINMKMHKPKLQFADPKEQVDLRIEINVGSDHYWKIVKVSPPLRISPSVVLLPSKRGFILSGNPSGN
jgi:hypothetical protein